MIFFIVTEGIINFEKFVRLFSKLNYSAASSRNGPFDNQDVPVGHEDSNE